ncbi:hypothetical protein BU25DRAFT_452182 [Macroventuria anomochaeta]|uniref:Uncharacterized protein n=1 Tax=Macroventuria anomochaeta TaxID=301207 RepID=A0ACB6RJT4_9PLEO|nr:uncharacterized protein BU25DRAFT_452182 [Macroventuria anomochaeta]KAF2622266.1 hypothetical protein BU25DRAFT_452182 [Macroventuria anomochaeta]
MPELLGLVASVIQVAGAGFQLSKTLFDLSSCAATSTNRLFMQVLTHAHQVASRKLDRAAEACQYKEIKQLLEKKDQSTQKHEELLRKDSASEDSTLVHNDDLRRDIGQSVTSGPVTTASVVNSTITAQRFATCVNHVRSFLRDIEVLQKALASSAPGDDHSKHHQSLVDSYFHTRGCLDQVVLGSSKPKTSAPAPSSAVYAATSPRYSPTSPMYSSYPHISEHVPAGSSVYAMSTNTGNEPENKNPMNARFKDLVGSKRKSSSHGPTATPSVPFGSSSSGSKLGR